MSLYEDTVHESRCSNCGHGLSARCAICLRAFSCGGMGVRCPVPDCNEGVIGHHVDIEYAQWLASHYEASPRARAQATHLEDPNPNTDYQLKSEVTS